MDNDRFVCKLFVVEGHKGNLQLLRPRKKQNDQNGTCCCSAEMKLRLPGGRAYEKMLTLAATCCSLISRPIIAAIWFTDYPPRSTFSLVMISSFVHSAAILSSDQLSVKTFKSAPEKTLPARWPKLWLKRSGKFEFLKKKIPQKTLAWPQTFQLKYSGDFL
jgi:hypothetical protein